MPLFALANTNIKFHNGMVDGLFTNFGYGIILGLALGKVIGINLFSFIAIKLKLSDVLKSRYKQTHIDNGTKLVIGTTVIEGKIGQRDRVYGVNNKIPTLTATDYKQPKQVLVDGILRKVTPLEFERLQTVPDNYTKCVSDTQRYKMLGNGWTVDVIAHILSFINGFEKTTERGQKI
jgi:site-specific DNA-cytosine methylase